VPSIPDILNIVILRNLDFRTKSEGYGEVSSRTVGEAFGVSKDQIQKLVKLHAERYGRNIVDMHPVIVDVIAVKLAMRKSTYCQDVTTRHVQVSGRLIQSHTLKFAAGLHEDRFISCFKWLVTVISDGYEPHDIFNMDEIIFVYIYIYIYI